MSRKGKRNRSKKNRNSSGASSKKSNRAKERLKAKKEKQKKIFFGVVGVIIIFFIVVGIVLVNVFGGGDSGDYGGVEYNQSNIGANSNAVEISVSEVSDGDFHYYSYDSGGTTVRYFVVRGSDGSIHTAFDACDSCYPQKKGYAQDGNQAKCRNCGNKYSINELGTSNTGGGCWPGMLKRAVSDDKIIIQLFDLRAGEYYFS